jgi:hypothetical protein
MSEVLGGRGWWIEEARIQRALGGCFEMLRMAHPLLSGRAEAAARICRRMVAVGDFDAEEALVLRLAPWACDLGLIALRSEQLERWIREPSACTAMEMAQVGDHPVRSERMVAFFEGGLPLGRSLRAHHERFDGRGFPDGIAGRGIPWTARCLAVAMAYVDFPGSGEEAAAYLEDAGGGAFDPEAVRLFFKASEDAVLPRNIREVLLSELRPGMCLARGIVGSSGVLLLPEGTVLGQAVIDKLLYHSELNLFSDRILVRA